MVLYARASIWNIIRRSYRAGQACGFSPTRDHDLIIHTK